MELNREQIIKALECCVKVEGFRDIEICRNCPLHDTQCAILLPQNALSLIKELTEENERLQGAVKQYEEERKYHFEMSRKRIAEAESKANAQAVRIECLEEENKQLKVDICNDTMNLEHITKDVEWSAKRIIKADKKIAELTNENMVLSGEVERLTVINDELVEDNKAQSETITSLLKTIEGVQGVKSEYETFIGGLKTQIDAIKAEERADTVRKMQERLKAQKFTHKNFGELVYVEDIDQIAKEMLEGKEICKNTHQKK